MAGTPLCLVCRKPTKNSSFCSHACHMKAENMITAFNVAGMNDKLRSCPVCNKFHSNKVCCSRRCAAIHAARCQNDRVKLDPKKERYRRLNGTFTLDHRAWNKLYVQRKRKLLKEDWRADITPDRRNFEWATNRLKYSTGVLPANKGLIERFVKQRRLDGKSVKTIMLELSALTKLCEGKPPMDGLSRADLEDMVLKVNGSGLGASSKERYRSVLKHFYERMGKPELVSWVKIYSGSRKRKLPVGIITPDDLKRMLDSTGNIQRRALLVFLWLSGCRIGEVLNMTRSSISFTEDGVRVTVPKEGKTGMRVLLIPRTEVDGIRIIKTWYRRHPYRAHVDSADCPLWTKNVEIGNGPMTYRKAQDIVNLMGKVIGRRIHPHLFRHSRATHLAKTMRLFPMMQCMGWTDTRTPMRYVHLSGDDVDQAIASVPPLSLEARK